jgi:hypothetical protein
LSGWSGGDDVGFETPLSSHHIGIDTKLCCRFEFSVAHYFLTSQLKSTAWWCTTKINKIKNKSYHHDLAKKWTLFFYFRKKLCPAVCRKEVNQLSVIYNVHFCDFFTS